MITQIHKQTKKSTFVILVFKAKNAFATVSNTQGDEGLVVTALETREPSLPVLQVSFLVRSFNNCITLSRSRKKIKTS